MKISVVTPTYNRANTLHRVYDSLSGQTNRDFEWIVIDDGSEDGTAQLIEAYKRKADFTIKYMYQENSGKHIALNEGVKLAEGEFIVIADSDDSFVPESFQVLLDAWEEIPEQERSGFRGITCRCYEPDTKQPIGLTFPGNYIDLYGLDAYFKYHYDFEMWGMNRTQVMKEFPFPEVREGLAYYPEIIIWHQMDAKYKVRYINAPLRAYFKDQENATTHKKRIRFKESVYLRQHYINDTFRYFFYSPMFFVKAFVGLSMAGFALGMPVKEILAIPNKWYKKAIVFLCMPAGYILKCRH